MIDWIFLLFLSIALIFMGLIIFYSKTMGIYWVTTLSLFGIILFYICSVGIMELEIPYQYFNTTSDTLETGYHQIINIENIAFSYFFQGLAIIVFINWLGYIVQVVSEWMQKRRMNP